MLGFNPDTRRFYDGLMCDTDENIIKGLVAYLQRHGIGAKDATQFAEDNYFRYSSSSHDTEPVDDPKFIMMELKSHGVKTAVCTSDSRDGNDAMILALGLQDVIDFSLCGDDEAMKPKPYPGNIELICSVLGVNVNQSIMVGDSLRDVQMGKQAGVKASVGVLSGVCDMEDFKGVADIVVPSINDVLKIAIPGNSGIKGGMEQK